MSLFHRRRLAWVIFLGLAAALLLVLLRPESPVPRRDPYFEALQQALRARGVQRPAVLIDLDRVDSNLAQIRQVLGADFQYRATTKSLPSYELLRYVLAAMKSQRVMEFHGPHLRPLIENLVTSGPTAAPASPANVAESASRLSNLDVLLGKPLPSTELDAFLAAPPDSAQLAATQLRWLIDDESRLAQYLAVAEKRAVLINLAIELDVGLRRGGVSETQALRRMVETIMAHPQRLRLTGVMGYDGHVPYNPSPFRSAEASQVAAFMDSMRALNELVGFLRTSFPTLQTPDFVINSGGSKTFPRYRQGEHVIGPVNDLAIGSAVLKPADFDVAILSAFQPALFIAEPVLKRLSPGRTPFFEQLCALWGVWNRNRQDVLYLYGGGWDLRPVYPEGLYNNPFYNDRPSDNRIPNQTMLNLARQNPVQPGDFVFYHPIQADVMVQFAEIYVVRSGQIIDSWHPIPRL